MKFIFQWSSGGFLCPNFSWRAPDLKLLKMEVLFGLGISNSWQVNWSFILIGWLTVTLRLEVQTQALAIYVSVAVNLLKYEFEFLVLCWESYVINLNKGGGILFWGGLLMQLVAADTDSGITQILKRSSCPGCKFDGHLCILIIDVGVEEFPKWLSTLVQVHIWVKPSNFNCALKHWL